MSASSAQSPARVWLASERQIALLCVGTVALVAGIMTAWTAWMSTYAILGRDQGIMQYVAWALAKGQRDYVDIRELNGPLIHALHMLLQRLGGSDEHVFRMLDITLSSLAFFATGALLARKNRLLWGVAAAVVLASQYLRFSWWNSAQRESFYDLFLLPALALQVFAHTQNRRWPFGLSGGLSALTWFGKPTCVIYSAWQVGVLLLDRDAPMAWRQRLFAFAIGCAASSVVMLGFVWLRGDLGSFVRVALVEMPSMHWWVWRSAWWESIFNWGNWEIFLTAVPALLVFAWLVAKRLVPLRWLVLLALPVGGLVCFFVQSKGFPYHLHPVSAGSHLLFLAIVLAAAERARRVAVVLAAVLAIGCLWEVKTSDVKAWYVRGRTPAARDSEAFIGQFPWGDFFAWDLRQAAAFLRANTGPDDRVQTYGMDPYLLFLARRLSATPYIASYELNVDAALAGGSGGRPSGAEAARLLQVARSHERAMLTALERNPPAAFALIDRSPFTWMPDADADFAEHCPQSAAFLRARYRRVPRLGAVRIWLRNDLPVRDAAAD